MMNLYSSTARQLNAETFSIFLVVALIVTTISDFILQVGGWLDQTVVWESSLSHSQPPNIRSVVNITRLERSGEGKLSAKIEIRVYATEQGVDIDSISLSMQEIDDTRDWVSLERSQMTNGEYVYDGKGPKLSRARTETEVSLRPLSPAKQVLFPFDKEKYELAPIICINDATGACLVDSSSYTSRRSRQRPALRTAKNTMVDYSILTWSRSSTSTATLLLSRDRFLRIVVLYFLLVSCGFVWYLLNYSVDRDMITKAFGVLLALWGVRNIVVPKSITIFPTAVDYGVLVLFAVIFGLILVSSFKLERSNNNE